MPDLTAGTEILAVDHPPSAGGYSGTNIDNISSTTFIAGSPQVDDTFVGPTSGKALLIVGGSAKGSDRSHMSVQVREDDVAGQVVETPQVTEYGWGGARTNDNFQYGSRVTMLESLQQGQRYFARHMHRNPGEPGSSGDIGDRDFAVIPLPFYWAPAAVGAPYIAADGEGGALARPLPPATFATSPESQLELTNVDPDYQAGVPLVSVTFEAPPSGKVLLCIGGGARDNAAGANRVFMTVEVRRRQFGGTVVVPAEPATFFLHGWSSAREATAYMYGSRVSILDGLIPGERYYARVMHSVEGGTGTDITVRDIVVAPVPDTAVHAFDDTTQDNIASASFVAGSPEVGAAFQAPPSGRVLVVVSGGGRDNQGQRVFVAPQIFNGASSGGSQFLAPDMDRHGWSTIGESTGYQYGSRASIVDGLTPGNTYFARTVHAAQDTNGNASSPGTADLTLRGIVVVPCT